jgi:replicative DNA helicase
MRLRNAKLEHRLILTACNNASPKTRRLVLAHTTPEDFSVEATSELRTYMHLELQRGRDIPKARYLADTPALSEDAQKLLRAPKKRQNEAKNIARKNVLRDIEELKRYRRARAANDGLLKAGETLSGKVGKAELQEFCHTLESTLAEVRAEFDEQPIVHYGLGATQADAKNLYRRLTSSAKHRFVSTGIDAIDAHLTGHSRGNLVVISAPRKGGKSTMAINMAINQFLQHHLNVLFVSLEMPQEDVEQRIAAKEGNLPFGLVRDPDQLSDFQKEKVKRFCKKLFRTGTRNNARFDIWPVVATDFTPEALYSGVQGMSYDVIYIDYLTLFSKKRQDLWEMQMEYSRLLKQYAKRLDCVMVTLTQVNANEQVKYGTAVEENLDTWFRWQWREDEEQETGDVDVRLALCRHAPTATFPSKFQLEKMTINIYPPSSEKKEKKSGGKKILGVNDPAFKTKLKKGEC